MVFSRRLSFWSQFYILSGLSLVLGCALAQTGVLLSAAWTAGMIATRLQKPGITFDQLVASHVTAVSSTPLIPLETTPVNSLLKPNPVNPRYFMDENGETVYLTGSHTWANLVDSGNSDPPPIFDYTAYLDFLQAKHHNFIRLWRTENAKGGETTDNYWFDPMAYQRTGPGNDLDGKPKFDLTKFNEAYFDRLRARVVQAGDRGIYVSIMMFDGWSVESKLATHHPWLGHPFNGNNNINGIDGDLNGNGSGEETHTLVTPAISPTITALQETYVRKVIDTVNDLDNVLYEISNESPDAASPWEYHMINFIKNYEATKPKQHPVGMTFKWPGDYNAELFASPADWISPTDDVANPFVADGKKVVINDTDHICGVCGDREWVWKSFTRGSNPIFMDQYDGLNEGRGAFPGYDPHNANDESIRLNMGYTRIYANRMNLAAMTPRSDLCSTGYCLANPVAPESEYLVYLPASTTVTRFLDKLGGKIGLPAQKSTIYLPWTIEPFGQTVTVDLSASIGQLAVEWLDPGTGMVTPGETITGGVSHSFAAPFSGDAVLYIYSAHP